MYIYQLILNVLALLGIKSISKSPLLEIPCIDLLLHNHGNLNVIDLRNLGSNSSAIIARADCL